jgi:thiamine biosynthesis protein ThiS
MNRAGEITIFINGKKQTIERGLSLARLLERLKIGREGTAVEIDGRLLAASEFEAHILQPGQKIEIVRLVGGG